MAPLFELFLGPILRHLLGAAFGYLAVHGFYTTGESSQLVAGLAGLLLTVLWSVWQKLGSRLKFLTALDAKPGTSEQAVKDDVAKYGTFATGRPILTALLVIGLACGSLSVAACGRSIQSAIAQGDQTAYTLVRAVVTDSEQLHAAGTITDAQFAQVNAALHPVTVVGRDLTKLLRAGAATPADAQRLYAAVAQAARDIRAHVGNSTAVARLLDDLGSLASFATSLGAVAPPGA